jgi:voltage-gated potassium channel
MKWLQNFIENDNTKSGRYFDIFIQVLIIISLVSFAVETLPDLNEAQRKFIKNT